MNVIYGKLNDLPLLSAHVLFEVNSPSYDRVYHLDLQPAILHFGQEFQKLTGYPSQPEVTEVNNPDRDRYTSSRAKIAQLRERLYSRSSNPTQCVFSPSEIASLWHLPHQGFTASSIAWARGRHVALPAIMRARQRVFVWETTLRRAQLPCVYAAEGPGRPHDYCG
jgi:hypothetical protein